MTTKSKEKNSLKKLSSFLKETNEKITLNFTKINNLLSNTKNILNNNNNNNKLILNLNIELKNLENFLKNFFKEILSQINNINSNYNSTNNSEEENNNFLDSTIKNSYNKVSNEFEEVEKKTIQIIKSLNINKEKRKKRIFLLENKLQAFVDDVSEFNYQNIKKEFDNNVNDNNKISNFILKNNIFIEKYKEIDYNYDDDNNNNNNNKVNKNNNYKLLQNLNNDNNNIENSNDNNNNNDNDDNNNDNNDDNNNDNDNNSIIQQLINIKTDEPNEIINVLESMINKKSNTSTIKNTKKK